MQNMAHDLRDKNKISKITPEYAMELKLQGNFYKLR